MSSKYISRPEGEDFSAENCKITDVADPISGQDAATKQYVDVHEVKTDDVSNPPTDAELDSIYGTPATVGSGFTGFIDDNGAGTNVYQVVSDGTDWWIFAGTKAV